MAQIRIVDAWLRNPAAPPTHYRSVMVVAEKWAEQRVLMRAYADSRDQTRPTIMLHGAELAIGPAGTDVNGPWGIHVGDNPDGSAQVIKQGLEESARRLAGSKGNPPRLSDEEPAFEREPTANWQPGTPRILPVRAANALPRIDYVAPVAAARVHQAQHATFVPQVAAAQHISQSASHSALVSAPSNPDLRLTPVPRRSSITQQTRPAQAAMRTVLGYTSGSGAQSAIVRLGLAPQVSALLGRFVDRVVPAEFHLGSGERRALNIVGERDVATAREIGQLLELADAVSFMEELVRKLEAYGLGDLIEPGNPAGGEPTYRLRR